MLRIVSTNPAIRVAYSLLVQVIDKKGIDNVLLYKKPGGFLYLPKKLSKRSRGIRILYVNIKSDRREDIRIGGNVREPGDRDLSRREVGDELQDQPVINLNVVGVNPLGTEIVLLDKIAEGYLLKLGS